MGGPALAPPLHPLRQTRRPSAPQVERYPGRALQVDPVAFAEVQEVVFAKGGDEIACWGALSQPVRHDVAAQRFTHDGAQPGRVHGRAGGGGA